MADVLKRLEFDSFSQVQQWHDLNSDMISYSEIGHIDRTIRGYIDAKYDVGIEKVPANIREIDNYSEYEIAVRDFYAQYGKDDIVLQWLDKCISYSDFAKGVTLARTKIRLYFRSTYEFNKLLESMGYKHELPHLSERFNGREDQEVLIYKNRSVKIHSDVLFNQLKPHIINYCKKYNIISLCYSHRSNTWQIIFNFILHYLTLIMQSENITTYINLLNELKTASSTTTGTILDKVNNLFAVSSDHEKKEMSRINKSFSF